MDKSKKKLIKTITTAAIILIILLIASLVINLVKLSVTLSKERKLKNEIAAMDQKIEQADNTIDELESFEFLDRYAREHLDMKGRDEKAFVPKDED